MAKSTKKAKILAVLMAGQFRVVTALGLAVVITGGLFFFMSALINSSGDFKKSDDGDNFINFVRMKNDSDTQVKKRQLPKKPPEPKDPPPPERVKVASNDTPKPTKMNMNTPKIDAPLGIGNGPFVGAAAAAAGDGDVMPLVRIEPQYPRKAAMRGIQGWVQLAFDITETGTVSNVRVIKANPKRIFDSAARRALLKWKYKPKTVDGKAVTQKGQKVQLDFKLEG